MYRNQESNSPLFSPFCVNASILAKPEANFISASGIVVLDFFHDITVLKAV